MNEALVMNPMLQVRIGECIHHGLAILLTSLKRVEHIFPHQRELLGGEQILKNQITIVPEFGLVYVSFFVHDASFMKGGKIYVSWNSRFHFS
ncbi:hypothetical protein D9O50_11690 [Oxalobacteraceae bacterium CAVE-383]|nr:hypothetical protein D9O50_11690 [Oxalobacteraceae bacterium CAVE-383]